MECSEAKTVEAFEQLVREHQAGLRAYVRALGVEESWVDDLAQDAFLVAYRRWEQFQAGADFGQWLRGIARNLARNEQRKAGRRSRLIQGALADVLLEDSVNAEEVAFDHAALLQAMRECVGQLPRAMQQMLHLRYAEGENASALARRWQKNAAAIRQSLQRARTAVKACVEKKVEGVWS